jgi:hypothetical protein
MSAPKKLNAEEHAPDFILVDHHNKEFRLSELKGARILQTGA